MIVREAYQEDMHRVIALLRDHHAAGDFASGAGPTGISFPFVPAYVAKLFQLHIDHEDGCALVLDVEGKAQGVLLAIASEFPFGPLKLARETVWWIDPAHRGSAAGRMLDAYEAWAQERGCAFAGMAGMGKDPVVAKLYRRRHYGVAETHFLKSLGA